MNKNSFYLKSNNWLLYFFNISVNNVLPNPPTPALPPPPAPPAGVGGREKLNNFQKILCL